MSRDTAELIVERINAEDSIASIWSFGMGEPLAHPDCYEIFRILNKIKRSADTPVILHTNGSCLTGEAAYAILDIPYITQLYISFDGYGTKESYDYMRGNHFEEVIETVDNFMTLVKKKRPGLFVGTCSIYPEAQFVPEEYGGGKYTFEEAETKLKSIFEPMSVHVSMRKLHKYNGFFTPEIYKGLEADALPTLPVLGGCMYLEDHSFELSWDGFVRPCRDAINEDFIIGNLRTNSFAEMVESEKFLSLRHQMRLDNRKACDTCANCDKFSFGEDIKAAANYWQKRLIAGDITDAAEREYIENIVRQGGLGI